MTPATEDQQHASVGAYALGVLDEAEAASFEEHLAGCERCAAELDDLVGLPPLLADLALSYDGAPVGPETLAPRPGSELLDRLLGEVAATRRTQRRRRLYLVAAAAALVIGGPFAGAALTSGDSSEHVASPVMELYEQGEKIGATDPVTKVAATVSLERKPWGTHVALKLANIKGPQKCELLAIGRDGEEETVITWAVPPGGYGITGGPHTGQGAAGKSGKSGKSAEWSKQPLYAHGGAALNRDDIDHFEVRTLDGKHLVSVKV